MSVGPNGYMDRFSPSEGSRDGVFHNMLLGIYSGTAHAELMYYTYWAGVEGMVIRAVPFHPPAPAYLFYLAVMLANVIIGVLQDD